MPKQECQESHTSTEYLDWMWFLDQEDWRRNDKKDYQLALIALEVRRIAVMLANRGKVPDLEDLLVEFTNDDGEKAAPYTPDPPIDVTAGPYVHGETALERYDSGGGKHGIEIGQPLDAKWQKINDEAKANWGAILSRLPEE